VAAAGAADPRLADVAAHLQAVEDTGVDRAGGRLQPETPMGGRIALRHAAAQHDDLADHELGDAASVRERRVEDRDAASLRRIRVHLVRPDAETADRDEPPRGREDIAGQLRARSDTDDVSVAHPGLQFVAGEGRLVALNVRVPVGPERVDRALVDALKEQDLDLVLAERGHCHQASLGRVRGASVEATTTCRPA